MELTELHKGIIALFFTLVFAYCSSWALDRLDHKKIVERESKPKQLLPAWL
jgi:hypothetical protein